MMKHLGLGLVTTLIIAGSTFAKAEVIRLPDTKVSMQMKNVGLRDTLENLLNKSQVPFVIADTINNDEKMSIYIKEAAWSDIFKFLVEQSKISYRTDNAGRLVLEKAPSQSI